MEAMEASASQSFAHGGVSDAACSQLTDRNNAVLSRGQNRDLGVRGTFSAHRTNKSPDHADSPP
jgi:hypothetical protein